MDVRKYLTAGVAVAALSYAPSALGCGGFFCGRQPVDQTAERIVFEIGDGEVTMTTQISFNGDAEDFAWVLPLGVVPDAESLSVFPQRALTALDANTGPVFYEPCFVAEAADGGPTAAPGGDETVTVHIRAEVGDYDVAVIESTDPDALIQWLKGEGFRVTTPMEPYIELYTSEGMKFLALKLLQTADVSDLKPFRFTLPGDTPSIPLRMTSLAAEPEMSILVFIFGDQRYEAKNWQNVEIDDSELRFIPFDWPLKTNWASLVAKAVDQAGGQGWVTELAGTTEGYVTQLQNQIQNGNFQTPEDEEAAAALLGVMQAHPYVTRLYTRLSAEEMTTDPIFGRSAGGDVSQFHEIQATVDGIDQCSLTEASAEPCDFVTCGVGGTCRTALMDDGNVSVAGCGCVPGATARTTFAPDGTATVICQDQRMSFLNPGDQDETLGVLPNPCVDFDCGENGSCVPVNMTPTCVCDEGYVAIGSFNDEGMRETTCVEPEQPISADFYGQRLPALPPNLPGGRDVNVPQGTTGGTSTSGAAGAPGTGGTSSTDGSTSGAEDAGSDNAGSDNAGCSCRLGAGAPTTQTGGWLLLAGLAFSLHRRRRRSTN